MPAINPPSTNPMVKAMEDANAAALKTTTEVNIATTKFNTDMQTLKAQHSAQKAGIDALKAAANNVAQMGRAQ